MPSNSQDKSNNDAVADWVILILGGAVLFIILKAAIWVWNGICSILIAIYHGFIYLGILLVSLLVGSILLCVFDAVRRWLVKRREFWDAAARCPLPKQDSFEAGVGLHGGIDHIFVGILLDAYRSKYGSTKDLHLTESEFAYIMGQEFPRALREPQNRALGEQNIASPLQAILEEQSNDVLNAWVDRVLAAKKRRKYFWITGRLVHSLSLKKAGYGPEDTWIRQSTEELRSSPSAFMEFFWLHGIPGIQVIEGILNLPGPELESTSQQYLEQEETLRTPLLLPPARESAIEAEWEETTVNVERGSDSNDSRREKNLNDLEPSPREAVTTQ